MSADLFLYATVADTPVAIPASQVEAVVRLGEVTPVQCVPQHVRGLAALRSRVLTVIDLEARVRGTQSGLPDKPLAVVVEIGGHTYGLIVAGVTDIAPAPDGVSAVQGRIDEMWSNYASGVVLQRGRSHLVLSVEDLIAGGNGSSQAA